MYDPEQANDFLAEERHAKLKSRCQVEWLHCCEFGGMRLTSVALYRQTQETLKGWKWAKGGQPVQPFETKVDRSQLVKGRKAWSMCGLISHVT